MFAEIRSLFINRHLYLLIDKTILKYLHFSFKKQLPTKDQTNNNNKTLKIHAFYCQIVKIKLIRIVKVKNECSQSDIQNIS